MGTPMRRLLHPKILSPLSPSFRSTQIREAAHGNENCNEPVVRTRNIAKTLNFHTTCLVKDNSPFRSNTRINTSGEVNNQTNIKLQVTDYSTGALLVNTPNKTNLLENGLYTNKDLKILGKGSFGVVVRGIYKGGDVAVKIAKRCKSSSLSLKEENALNLDHENVVKIIDIVIRKTTNYGIVLMEYLNSSRHLQSILDDQSKSLNLHMIVKYGLDICRGLQYCHENRVLHLDLKPSNVLVCEDHLCKLCDFGNSVKLDDIHQNGAYQGTVAYAAPELLLGKPPTTASDVYSLGILLWQMRHREIPYSEFDAVEVIIYKVVKFNYRPVSTYNTAPLIQDDYFVIYSSCWSADSIDRIDIPSIINRLSVLY